MPRKVWDTKADFDGAYSIRLERYTGGHPNTRAELRGNYERRALFSPTIPQLDYVTPEWERILAHFGWATSTTMLIVGCGFGWAIEYLQSQGYLSSWGVEPSLYIQGAKDETDPEDGTKRSLVATRIHDQDVSRPANRGQLLRDTVGPGNRFDVIVTERVMSSLPDADAVSLRNDLDEMIADITGQIVHIENSQSAGPGSDPTMVWRTLAELKTLFPLDTIVRSGGGEFL